MTIQAKFHRYQPVDAGFKIEKPTEHRLGTMKITLDGNGVEIGYAKRLVEASKELFWKVW